ncbi:MAG: Re/Si-specific NAD(P)(+) transhydrogenase subunit alpha [Myxococcaceae bacterium]|nr:Re/Si-specific NAD(P)(+) transhydrogenase subunit alpha [Myxococcaceae bacterium]
MLIGIPKETGHGEKRVAASPESVRKLKTMGFELCFEPGVGTLAGFTDAAFAEAGATACTNATEVFSRADILIKVRAPSVAEAVHLKQGAVLISLLQTERLTVLLEALNARKVSALALERIPRITRAQKMDVLSSMANLAGYRAVLEAAHQYQGFFGGQVTAAGSLAPAKVLVIGAGVAGLAAIGAAKALGAEVRAFDTRAAAREQVESLGAKFLEVDFKESGEGGGGYAKLMSPEFIAAEMKLFKAQAKECNIVITTALIPGVKAPILLPRDVVEALAPGSVIVDMAAEQGGNCELCKPGEVVDYQGVKVVGYTDLPSRMAATASRFFANNVLHLLSEMSPGNTFTVDTGNDVVRPALVCHEGQTLPPPPKAEPSPAPVKVKVVSPPPPGAKPLQNDIMRPTRYAWGTGVFGLVGISALFLLGRFAPPDFLQHSTVFILACFVGWQVIWSVSPSLHTPLMSVTNAISGIIILGGMLQIGQGFEWATLLGAAAVLLSAINIAGGFLVTQRMLKMFRRESAGGH